MRRVNARLDESTAEKLEYLQATTGLSLSDVVRESVEHYHAEVQAEAARRASGLVALIGAFDGRADTPTDLSATYKQHLWPDLSFDSSSPDTDVVPTPVSPG